MDQRIRLTCPCGVVAFGDDITPHAESCEKYKSRPKYFIAYDSIIENGVHTIVNYDESGVEVSREVEYTGGNSLPEQMMRAVVDPEWKSLCKPKYNFSVHGAVENKGVQND